MGSLLSYISPNNDETPQEVTGRQYGRTVFGKRHPRTVLEDINKLSPQELENEFNKMCKRFTDNLKPLACGLNPCEKFCDALKVCASQNPDHLICCFEPMRQYRECVYNHMQERLEEFLQDEPENLADASLKDLREVKDAKEAKNVKDLKEQRVENKNDLKKGNDVLRKETDGEKKEKDDEKKGKGDEKNEKDDEKKEKDDEKKGKDGKKKSENPENETEEEKAKKIDKDKEAKKTKQTEKATEVKVTSVG